MSLDGIDKSLDVTKGLERVVIKFRYGIDIRKQVIHNDQISFNDVVLMIKRVYSDGIDFEGIILKYRDEDGDLVTLTEDTEISLTINQSKGSKDKVMDLSILKKNEIEMRYIDDDMYKSVLHLRDTANCILEKIRGPSACETKEEKEHKATEIKDVKFEKPHVEPSIVEYQNDNTRNEFSYDKIDSKNATPVCAFKDSNTPQVEKIEPSYLESQRSNEMQNYRGQSRPEMNQPTYEATAPVQDYLQDMRGYNTNPQMQMMYGAASTTSQRSNDGYMQQTPQGNVNPSFNKYASQGMYSNQNASQFYSNPEQAYNSGQNMAPQQPQMNFAPPPAMGNAAGYSNTNPYSKRGPIK